MSFLLNHKKYIFLALVFLLILPVSAMAAPSPTQHIQIDGRSIGGDGITGDQIYQDLNQIVTLIYFVAGFISLIALIIAAVLLMTSGSNPNRRSGGFVALGMAALGGWILYKAGDIAVFLQAFGQS